MRVRANLAAAAAVVVAVAREQPLRDPVERRVGEVLTVEAAQVGARRRADGGLLVLHAVAHLEQQRLQRTDALGARLAHVVDEGGAHALVRVEEAALVRVRVRVRVR